jgi:7-dehydrocholesterol reductase
MSGPAPMVRHRFGHAREGLLQRWIAPLGLLLFAPPFTVLLWVAAAHFDGSLLAALSQPARALAVWPMPSLTALGLVAGFAALQLLLLRVLPGDVHFGPTTPMGNRPSYKLNGVPAFAATHALIALAAHAGLVSPTIVYDRFGEILVTLNIAALALCAWSFVKGIRSPSTTDAGRSGNVVWDFFWGVELHPRVLGVDLKQLVNCRIAMLGWSVIVLSFAAAQQQIHGELAPAMLVSVGLVFLYILRFFVGEHLYFATIDIIHDRFGFYIAWGILVWLPAVYTVAPLYLVTHAHEVPPALSIAAGVVGLAALAVGTLADFQRHRVRETNGRAKVWGRAPVVIRAPYETADGRRHENLLLASGFWGVARHFHYAAEIALAIAWTVPSGASHLLPWIYPLFLTILLVHRSDRDDLRCRGKYGPAWEEYCRRVPWRIVPGVL